MTQSHFAWLAPDIHFAWVGADVVVLDVRQDRYLCLVDGAEAIQPGSAAAAASAATVSIAVRDPETLGVLRQAGLIDPATPTRPRTLACPARSALMPGGRPSVGALLRAVANAVASTAAFKRSDLKTLIAHASAWRRRPLQGAVQPAARALDAFNAMLPWMPCEEDCLQRAYMLRHHLHANGLSATWIFGVRTWPFLAHCWVQIDDVVVGDSVERVGGFTPILAV